MSSPFGHAQFEVSARAIESFLQRTYQVVPVGRESAYLNFDAELTELLSQALANPRASRPGHVARPQACLDPRSPR